MTVTGSREALKPCPFCKCARIDVYTEDGDDIAVNKHVYVAQCWDCSARIDPVVGRARAVEAWNTRASPDPAGVTLTVEEIARLFAEHVRLVPVDPDGYARHAEYIDNIDDDLCWKVKPESKDAAATAILSLIQSKMGKP